MIVRPALLAAALVVALVGGTPQDPHTEGIYIDDPSLGVAGEYVLTVDGQPTPIVGLAADPQPLSALVLQDVSGSVRAHPARETARRLVPVARPGDAVRLGTFADKILIGTAPITDRASADIVARQVDQPAGASPLWDAVSESIDVVRGASGMRVVVVFSDGMATANNLGFDDADDLAVRSGVIVCVAGVSDAALPGNSKMQIIGRNEGLRRLARDTGGAYRELLKPDDDPVHLMVALLDDLRGRARLEFVPPFRDGTMHRLEISRRGRPVTAPARRVF